MDKKLLWHRVLLLNLVIFIIPIYAFSATYTTITNGDWDDGNIWSLDGINACSCFPTASTAGNDIIIKHEVSATTNLWIDGNSTLTIESTGELAGNYNLNVVEGTVNIYGDAYLAKTVISETGTMNLFGLLYLTNRFIIDGVLNIDAGYVYMQSGNITVNEIGAIYTSNAGKVDAMGGNIENYGTVDICFNCCMTTLGNWKNYPTGTVLGTGSATTTGGNMTNSGSWDMNITWCSVGYDAGMPSNEDCTTSNTNCGLVVLPVEMIVFEAKNTPSCVAIRWETAFEYNTSHFNVLKSFDGVTWEAIDRVASAGNSQSTKVYSSLDYNNNFEVAYYRLEQVDVDGTARLSTVRSVLGSLAGEMNAFPNPATTGNQLEINQLILPGVLTITSSNGSTIMQTTCDGTKKTLHISTENMLPGMYFIKYTNELTTTTKRVVIQ